MSLRTALLRQSIRPSRVAGASTRAISSSSSRKASHGDDHSHGHAQDAEANTTECKSRLAWALTAPTLSDFRRASIFRGADYTALIPRPSTQKSTRTRTDNSLPLPILAQHLYPPNRLGPSIRLPPHCQKGIRIPLTLAGVIQRSSDFFLVGKRTARNQVVGANDAR